MTSNNQTRPHFYTHTEALVSLEPGDASCMRVSDAVKRVKAHSGAKQKPCLVWSSIRTKGMSSILYSLRLNSCYNLQAGCFSYPILNRIRETFLLTADGVTTHAAMRPDQTMPIQLLRVYPPSNR